MRYSGNKFGGFRNDAYFLLAVYFFKLIPKNFVFFCTACQYNLRCWLVLQI